MSIYVVLTLLACGVERPRPDFVVHKVENEGCGRLFDVCVRTNCYVENRGKVAGTARVRFAFTDPKKKTEVVAHEEVLIAAGQLANVAHEFPEVTLGTSNDATAGCELE